jgi:hypothetical protein
VAAPRGQNKRPTPRLTANPIATSSTRTMPTCQPTGWMMLKSTTSVIVKPAWPAANEIARGAYAASRTATGSMVQSTA